MLITVGKYRINLFNVNFFDTEKNAVHFASGYHFTLTQDEANTFVRYWNLHSEQLDTKDPERGQATPDAEDGRDFVLGTEVP